MNLPTSAYRASTACVRLTQEETFTAEWPRNQINTTASAITAQHTKIRKLLICKYRQMALGGVWGAWVHAIWYTNIHHILTCCRSDFYVSRKIPVDAGFIESPPCVNTTGPWPPAIVFATVFVLVRCHYVLIIWETPVATKSHFWCKTQNLSM